MASSDPHFDPELEETLCEEFTPDVLRKWIELNPKESVKAHTISMCPIAKCLRSYMDPTITVDGMSIFIDLQGYPRFREAALPNWASRFAQDFDKKYAGLEVKAIECLPLIPDQCEGGQKPVKVFRSGWGNINAPA